MLDQNRKITSEWDQDWILGIEQWFIDQCPKFKHLEPSVLVHSTNSDIPYHSDGISKSVFVFPIKYGKCCEFYVDNTFIKFKRGEFYRFNDYLKHGINNPNRANMVLVTVSFEKPFSYRV